MSAEWEPPRCRHGQILLGCPDDDCPEQNAYLAQQNAALEQYEQAGREAAREVVEQVLRGEL